MKKLYIEENRSVGTQLPLEVHIEIQNLLRPILVAYRKHEEVETENGDDWFSRFPYCVSQKTIQGRPIIGLCKKDYAKILNVFYDLIDKEIDSPYQLIDRLLPDDEFGSIDDKCKYLQNECCAYYLLMDEQNANIKRVLKLDLFRLIDFSKKKKRYEFIGGLFHSLVHFEEGDLHYYKPIDIYDWAYMIASAFTGELRESGKRDTDYETYLFLPDANKRYKAVFYLEKESGVYSLRTFHRDDE